jgi:hypothetical protein
MANRTLSLDEAIKHFGKANSSLRTELTAAVRFSLQNGVKLAQLRSSGPYSTAMLRAADHPYATRHGSPKLDPGTINQQSGVFRSSWQTDGPSRSDTPILGLIFNDSEVADYLQFGTRTMFARPIAENIERDTDATVFSQSQDAADRIERTFG